MEKPTVVGATAAQGGLGRARDVGLGLEGHGTMVAGTGSDGPVWKQGFDLVCCKATR